MFRNAVIFAQVPFRLISKIFNAIAVIASIVLKLGHIPRIIGTIIVSVECYQAPPSHE